MKKFMEKDEVLFEHPWIAVRETPDGFAYAYESRTDCRGVALFIFDNSDEELKIAGRFERCPAHGDKEPELYSLTGGVEVDTTDPYETAVEEAKEEAGIEITKHDLIPLGILYPWKGAATTQYLFAVDWSGKELGKAEGDGSKFEEGSYCKWITASEAIKSRDPMVHALLLRAFEKGLITSQALLQILPEKK